MSYIALYRKYRPRKFDDVVGQDTIIEILRNSIINKHISHAYLFTGPRGTGKTSTAKILARAVNCLNFNKDVCDNCDVCNFMRENDSDIIEIDAASNNGVDEIRTLRENVKLMPSFCKYKIYIIDEVHMLSTGAFNALLKTLEEPPSHVIFILATTEPNKIPITIMSRCQRFDFESITPKNIYKKLKEIVGKEQLQISDDILDYISKNSDGGLRDSINMLDQIVSLGKGKDTTLEDAQKIIGKISLKTIVDIYNAILNKDYNYLLNISNEFINEGKNLKDIVNMLLTVMRDLIISKEVKNYFDINYYDELNNLNFPTNKILDVSNCLNKLLNEMKYTNNESMIFQIYLLNLVGLCDITDNTNIIDTKTIIENKNNKVKDRNMNIKKENSDKTIKNENAEINTSSDIKKIRINNCLATADKALLNEITKDYEKINDYYSSKKYNNLVEILKKGKIIVAAKDYVMLEFNDESDTSIFDLNINDIEMFFEKVFNKNYKVVSLTKNEWNTVREKYVLDKKNNIKYTIIEENVVKSKVENSNKELENTANNLFGDDAVSIN